MYSRGRDRRSEERKDGGVNTATPLFHTFGLLSTPTSRSTFNCPYSTNRASLIQPSFRMGLKILETCHQRQDKEIPHLWSTSVEILAALQETTRHPDTPSSRMPTPIWEYQPDADGKLPTVAHSLLVHIFISTNSHVYHGSGLSVLVVKIRV